VLQRFLGFIISNYFIFRFRVQSTGELQPWGPDDEVVAVPATQNNNEDISKLRIYELLVNQFYLLIKE